MAENDFLARFKTEGERRFIRNFRNAGDAAGTAGERVEDSGRKARRASRGFASLSTSMSGTGRTALRAGAGMRVGVGSALALAGSFIGVSKAVRSMAEEYQESVKVGAQTTSVLKSTGHAAGITKRHVENLSDAISRKIAVDDEEIQSSANLLLTFKKIRNETGKGNKIFDRATMAVQDLSARMGVGARSSAIMLGKALQDPVKGLTALGRAGVSFSEKQKTMVKRMVETGNQLGAQRFLLREIESQVKGAAASQATPIDRLRVSWGNLAESMGKLGAPIVTKGITALGGFLDRLDRGGGVEKLAAGAKGLFAAFQGKAPPEPKRAKDSRATGPGTGVGGGGKRGLTGVQSFAKKAGETFRTVIGTAKEAGRSLLDAFKPALPFFQNIVGPLLLGFAKGVLGTFVLAFKIAVPVIKGVATVLGWLGQKAAPLKGVFEGIGMVLSLFIGGPVTAALGAIPKVGLVFRLLAGPLRLVSSVFQFLGKILVARVVGPVGLVRAAFTGLLRFFTGFAKKFALLGAGIVTAIVEGIKAAPGALLDALKSVLGAMADGLPFGLGGKLKDALGIDEKARGGRARYTGPHVVGERGPEIVNLNRGDHVTPNARLGRAAGALTGGAAFLTVPIVVELDGYQVGRGMGRIALQDLARA